MQPSLFPSSAFPQATPSAAPALTVAALTPQPGFRPGFFWVATFDAGGVTLGTALVGAHTLAQARRQAVQLAAAVPASAVAAALSATGAACRAS